MKKSPVNTKESFPLKIEKFSFGPDALGFKDGQAVFVPLAVPEDQIEASWIIRKKSYGIARINRILKPSPDRIEPACPLFGPGPGKGQGCGGCQWQMASYERQLQAKKEIVAESLERIAKISAASLPIEACVGMKNPWNYRNKVQYPLQRTPDGRLSLGYFERGSHRIIDLDSCPVELKMFERPLQDLKVLLSDPAVSIYDEKSHKGILRHLCLRGSERTGELLLTFVASAPLPTDFADKVRSLNLAGLVGMAENVNSKNTNIIYGSETRALWGAPFYHEKILDKTFRVSADSFFQTNTEQAEKIAADLLARIPARLNTIWDVYSGTGLFALLLAHRAEKVFGIESAPQSLADARHNQETQKADNVTWLKGEAGTVLPGLDAGPDLAVVDPPRAGLEPAALEALLRLKPRRLAYVSCDPATLARDIGHMVRQGWGIERIVPFDLFPHTYHVETLAYLVPSMR